MTEETSGHLGKPVSPFSLCGPQHSSGNIFPLFYYLNVNKLISFQSFAVVYPYDNTIHSLTISNEYTPAKITSPRSPTISYYYTTSIIYISQSHFPWVGFILDPARCLFRPCLPWSSLVVSTIAVSIASLIEDLITDLLTAGLTRTPPCEVFISFSILNLVIGRKSYYRTGIVNNVLQLQLYW